MPIRCTNGDRASLERLKQAGMLSRVQMSEHYPGTNEAYVQKRLNKLIQEGYIRKTEDKNYELAENGERVLGGEQVHSEKRRRQRAWTERDVAVLRDLYQMREGSKRQLVEKHFGSRTSYGNKRLEVLQRECLIGAKRVGKPGKKGVWAYYFITEKGMRLLMEKGLVPEGEVRARDLKLTDKQRSYILDANEIHFKLESVAPKFLNSRQIKKKQQLNRGDLIAGAFESDEGDYCIYVLQEEPSKQTLDRVLKEIRDNKRGRAAYLIYYKGSAARKSFERAFVQQQIVTGGIQVHVLPCNERGFEITKRLIFGKGLPQLLEPYGKLVFKESEYGFLWGMKCTDGTNKYVLEYLTRDRIVIDRSLRSYKGVKRNGESQGVLLFCWEEDAEAMRERVKYIPCLIEVIGLSYESAFETSLLNS